MDEQRQRTGLFSTLKQVLKSQGLRYRDLAELMNTSEPTIKRLFKDQDCKLSRLMDICKVIGVNFTDLVELSSNSPTEPTVLSIEIESALVGNPGLMSFFMLLVSDFDLKTIASQNNLQQTDIYLYLRELEKLSLIRLGQGNQFYFVVNRPIKWRSDGPMLQTLVRVNKRFIAEAISSHTGTNYPFYSASRLLSETSSKQFYQEVDNLYFRFQQQATLDQMFYPTEELKPFKLVATTTPFDLPSYFKVPAFTR
ncbi:helix-turn-helix domain-containing protein [Moritella viscosa]|uniref:Mlr4587 protein n=1 Tax=Moritella viscosa TaxID=80854 RepID=A0A090IJK2_9GAMM|nr:helix-turn-helix transcriptional regulator [Moritella viscosa]CED60389.1 putative DNA-binding protein [Moritella viscosa]SGY97888.1 Mlr4587 protein [Moritella viscosa]SGZ04946.1 Mlr4587 protein [Moritella viscosa]SGZ11502.1 Mlr4587 protein [Moritella viscosa]SGZ11646.1 Mlr4587 protein [Moritella viscosa]